MCYNDPVLQLTSEFIEMRFRVHPCYCSALVKMKCLIYLYKTDNSVIIEKLNDTWLKYVYFYY